MDSVEYYAGFDIDNSISPYNMLRCAGAADTCWCVCSWLSTRNANLIARCASDACRIFLSVSPLWGCSLYTVLNASVCACVWCRYMRIYAFTIDPGDCRASCKRLLVAVVVVVVDIAHIVLGRAAVYAQSVILSLLPTIISILCACACARRARLCRTFAEHIQVGSVR